MKDKNQANDGDNKPQQLAKLKPESYEEAFEMVRNLVLAEQAEDFIRLITGLSDEPTKEQEWRISAAFHLTGCFNDSLEIYKRAIREGYKPDEGFSPYHFHIYEERGERVFVPAPRLSGQPSTNPLALADAIATVLNHPDVPGELYDAMVAQLSTMHDDTDMDTDRDMLRVWIPKRIASQKEQEVKTDGQS